jgi:hypothetical protein
MGRQVTMLKDELDACKEDLRRLTTHEAMHRDTIVSLQRGSSQSEQVRPTHACLVSHGTVLLVSRVSWDCLARVSCLMGLSCSCLVSHGTVLLVSRVSCLVWAQLLVTRGAPARTR